eukprot:5093823-Pyramimonas_sp.AAC.1
MDNTTAIAPLAPSLRCLTAREPPPCPYKNSCTGAYTGCGGGAGECICAQRRSPTPEANLIR